MSCFPSWQCLKREPPSFPSISNIPKTALDICCGTAICKTLIDETQLETFERGQADYSTGNPEIDAVPENLVYAIYTSGSTGRPKGALMHNRGMVNLLTHHFRNIPIHCARVLQFTSFSFDVSFQEIFFALLSGKELYIVAGENRLNPVKLVSFIRDHSLEVLFLPTAFLKHLMNELANTPSPDDLSAEPPSFPHCVRHIITAGEQLILNPASIQLLNRTGITLHNHYGPAETHVVTTHTLPVPISEGMSAPHIGRPISNAMVYILDKRLQPVPIGVSGEIFLGGFAVGRGYLNRPELTAERFVPDPFITGNRLYCTGDIGKWLPDGSIRFIGRKDHQIKIRGFRVETGEVEAALNDLANIDGAFVSVHETENDEKQLVAYIVSSGQSPLP